MVGRRAVLAGLLAWACVASVGCGGRGEPTPYETQLTEPWTAMGLPLGEASKARVIYSDERMLTVHVDGGDRASLTQAWATALEASGLKRGTDSSGADMTSITWSNDEAIVALGLIDADGRVEVSLTRYPRS